MNMGINERDPLTAAVIGAAIEGHRHLGPGLLEKAYEVALCAELELCGIAFQRQVPQPVHYKGVDLDCEYRMDIVVEGRLILELKSVEALLPLHTAQILTYMKLANIRVGLLMNFNTPMLKDGFKRYVL